MAPPCPCYVTACEGPQLVVHHWREPLECGFVSSLLAASSPVTSGRSSGREAILREHQPYFALCQLSPTVPAFSGSERWALATEGAAIRKLMATLAVGMAVTGGSVASAQDPEDALTVTLHVTNFTSTQPISQKSGVCITLGAQAIRPRVTKDRLMGCSRTLHAHRRQHDRLPIHSR